MSMPVVECGAPINKTSTGDVAGSSTQNVKLLGFFCNSTSSGTLVLRQGGSGGAVITGTITPTAGLFYRFPADCQGPLHATIANTLDVTFFVAF